MRHRGLGTPVEEPEPSTMSSDPLLSSASSSASADPNTAAAPFSIPPRLPYNKQWWEEMDGFIFPSFFWRDHNQTWRRIPPNMWNPKSKSSPLLPLRGRGGSILPNSRISRRVWRRPGPQNRAFSSCSTCFSLSTRNFFFSSMKPGSCWASFPEGCKLFGWLWNFSCPTVVVTGPSES